MARLIQRQRTGTRASLLVVGLGNPGPEYAHTRHNAGQWVINELIRRHGGRLRGKRQGHSTADELTIGEHRVAVAIPTTYMNESGRAIRPLLRRYGVANLERLVIVHDELDLPVGRMKLKHGGGIAGNNGLRSIRSHLRDDSFTRIRIGIGKPVPGTMKGRDYVLRRPGRAEQNELDRVISCAADALEFLAGNDINEAMNRFNGA